MSKISPNTDNYTIHRGKLFVRDKGATAWRALGNAPSFSLTPNVEKYEHFSSQAGIKLKDKEITQQVSAEVSITLDEFTGANLALPTLASRDAYTQAAAIGETETYAAGAVVGNVFKLPATDVSNVSITDTAGTATYVAGTHYVLDAPAGLFSVIALPADKTDTDLVVTYDVAAVTAEDSRDYLKALQDLDKEVSFMCVGVAAGGTGNSVMLVAHRLQIMPNESIEFINSGDELSQINLSGSLLADETQVGNEYFSMTELAR